MGDTRIGTGAGNSSGKFIATNTPSTAANVHLNSHMWVGDNRDGAGSGRSDGQFLLNLGGGNFSFVSNTAGGYEFQVGDGRNIGGAFGEFLLTNFQNAAIGLQSSPSASEMRVGHDGTGTGSGMVTGLMTYARGSNVSILLNNHIRVGENFGYGLLTFDNVTNVSIRTTGELRVGDGTGGAGTGEVRFLNGSMLQRLDVGGVVRIGDEGNNGSWGRFVATNTPNAATGFNFSNTFNVGYGQNHYGQFLLDAGASHIYWVSNQNAGFEFNVGRGDSTEEAWGQVLWTNAQSVGMGFHGANAANIYVGRYGKNASTTELSTGLVRIVGVSNMNLRVNEFQVGYRRAHGEFVFDGVTNLAIRAQSIRIADTDDGNNGFANGFVYGTNGTRLTSFAVDGILHVGTHSNSVGRLIFTNTSQTTDLRIESTIQVGGLGGAVNNTEGEVRFALGGGNMFLLTNANAEFSVGRGNAASGLVLGQFAVSNIGNAVIGNQTINHNHWRIGFYGTAASPATGLVTFSTVSNMNVRMGQIDVGFRRAHGQLVFDAVTNLTMRMQTLNIANTDDDAQAFATGFIYGTNGTRLSSFAVDGATVIGRGSNSVGQLIFTNSAQTLNLRMSDGIFVGGQGSVANNTTGLMMFAAGGGTVMLRTNNADFSVGRGNGGSGSAFGQVWISNASSVIVGNQDNNWQGWRIGHYGGSGAGQKATGLVTFADVGSMNIRLGEFQVGYRDGYGEILFQNVTNLNIRTQTMWVGERENGSTDGGHGYFYVDGGSSLTNFRVDGEMNIGRAGNSTGRVIIDGVLGDYFVGQSMRVGNLAGGTGSFIATNANNNGSFYVGHSFFVGAWDGANNTTGNVVLNMNNNIFGWSTTNAGGHLFVVGRDAGTYGRVIISNMGAGSFVGHTVNNDHDFYVGENGGSGHVEFVGGQWGGRLSQLRVGGDGAGLGYFDASTATLSNLNVNFVRIGNDGNRTGQVFLAGGTMTINNELSLGHSGTGRGLLSLSNMTVNVAPAFTVNNNSVLRLENTTVNNAGTMTINGNGWMGSDGVLRNVSGNSTITGTVDKASAVTIRVDSGSLTLGGNFTGNQNMTLTGDGILRLNGVSTHNVGTVSGGTLELNNTNHTFNGGLTVQSGGGLQGNNARITGNVTIQSNATFSTGTDTTIGTLTFSNNLTFDSGSYGFFNFSGLTGAGNFDSNRVFGTLNLNAGSTFEFYFDALPSDTDAFVLFQADAGNYVVPTNLIWSGAVASGWAGWIGNDFVISNAIGLQAYIWTGGGGADANWANAANWSGGVPPPASTISEVVFANTAATANNPTTTNPWTMMTLTFSNLAGMGSWILQGEQLTVFGTNGVSIRQENAAAQTISNNILIAESNQGWVASGGDLRLGGAVLVGTNDLLLSGNSNFVFIAGGDLRVNGGTVSNVAGGLLFNGGQAHLTNTILEVAAGVLTVTNGGAINLHGSSIRNANAIQLSGLGQGNAGALRTLAGTSFVTGQINLVGNAGLGTDSGATLDLTNLVTGSGVLVKVGGGTLVLRTNNTYTGGTIISNGTLAVTANGRINHASGDLIVGGQNAILVITNGGMVTNRIAYVGFASGDDDNGVLLSGASSRWVGTSNIWVGYDGSENTVTVTDGATLETAADLNIGRDGDSNVLEVTGGAVVRSANGSIGDQAAASGNTVVVSGTGSLWTNTGDLHVGRAGDDSSLVIFNEGRVSVASNLWVGSGAGSAGNSLLVNSGDLVVTNAGGTANLIIGGAGTGAATLSGDGSINADRFYMTNAGTTFTFNDGTMRTRGTVVSNGASLTVGDGTGDNTAIYIAEGGTHTFHNGLLLNTNAHFSGTGTVTGNVTNRGVMSVGANGGADIGTVVFSNNLVLTATSTSLFSFASASSFDSNRVAGAFVAGGNLALTFDYNPLSGQVFTIVQGGVGSSGTFASSNLFGTYSAFINSWTHGFVGNDYRVTIVNADAFSYWDGGDATSGNWNTTGFTNWNPDGITPSNKVIVFGGTTRQINTNNFASNATFISIVYTNGGFTNYGNTVRLTKGMINETGTNVFNAGINLGASQAFNVLDGLLQVNGNIAGTGFILSKTGEGVLVLGGTNTYTGGTIVDEGTMVVSGPGRITHLAAQMRVGMTNGGATLVISNGGFVSNAVGTIGNAPGASNNTVLVDGSGTRWWNNSTLFVGSNSAGNSVTISDGAFVRNLIGQIGFTEAASNNALTVTGAGSVWSNFATVVIGNLGEGNALTIADGAEANNTTAILGLNQSGSNNVVTVTGAGSVWSNRQALTVGQSGAHNTMIVADDAVVYSAAGSAIARNDTSFSNSVVLNGGTWSNQGVLASLTLGNTNSLNLGGNRIVITNGGYLFNQGPATIGNLGSIANTVFIGGADSRWLNAGLFVLGNESRDNMVTVTNGGLLNGLNSAVIGATESSTNNLLLIGSGGSVVVTNDSVSSTFDLRRGEIDFQGGSLLVDKLFWTNGADSVISFDNGSLTMKAGMEFNESVVNIGVSNGQTFTMTLLGGTFINQAASPRTVALGAGTGSVGVLRVSGVNADLDNTEHLVVGLDGRGQMILTNAGDAVTLTGVVGSNSGSAGSSVLATGNNSEWQVNSTLTVGATAGAVSNTLTMLNGGRITAFGPAIIGAEGNRQTVLVSGANSRLLSQSLIFGLNGASNTMTITNGGEVRASGGSIVVGSNSASVGNQVNVFGGRIVATNNAGTGALDLRRGTITLGSNGAIYANTLRIRSNAVFNPVLSGGTVFGNMNVEGTAQVQMGTNDFLRITGVLSNAATINLMANPDYTGFAGIELGAGYQKLGTGQMVWNFVSSNTVPYFGGLRFLDSDLSVIVDSGDIVLGGATSGDIVVVSRVYDGTNYFTLSVGNFSRIWDGGGSDNNWSTGANWVGDTSPVNDGTALIIFAANPGTRTNPFVNSPWSVQGIRFTNSMTSSYRLGGQTISVGFGGVNNNSDVAQYISNNMVYLTDSSVRGNNADMHMLGQQDFGANKINVGGNSNVYFFGNIVGEGLMRKTNSGTLFINGVDTTLGGLWTLGGTTMVNGVNVSIQNLAGTATLSNTSTFIMNGLNMDVDRLYSSNAEFNIQQGRVNAGSVVLRSFAGILNVGTSNLVSELNILGGTDNRLDANNINIGTATNARGYLTMSNSGTQYILRVNNLNVGTGAGATGIFYTGPGARFTDIDITGINIGTNVNSYGYVRMEAANSSYNFRGSVGSPNVGGQRGTGILELANMKYDLSVGGAFSWGNNANGGLSELRIDDGAWFGGVNSNDFNLATSTTNANGGVNGRIVSSGGGLSNFVLVGTFNAATQVRAKGDFIFLENGAFGNTYLGNSVNIGTGVRSIGNVAINAGGNNLLISTNIGGNNLLIGRSQGGNGQLFITNAANVFIGENAATGSTNTGNKNFYVGSDGIAGESSTGVLTFADVDFIRINVNDFRAGSDGNYGNGTVILDNIGGFDFNFRNMRLADGISSRGIFVVTNSAGGTYSLVVTNAGSFFIGSGQDSYGQFLPQVGFAFTNFNVRDLGVGTGVRAYGEAYFEGENRLTQALIQNRLRVGADSARATGNVTFANANIIMTNMGTDETARIGWNARGGLGIMTLDNATFGGTVSNFGVGVGDITADGVAQGYLYGINGSTFSNLNVGVDFNVGVGNQGAIGQVIMTNINPAYSGDVIIGSSFRVGSGTASDGRFLIDMGGADFIAPNSATGGVEYFVGRGPSARGLLMITNADNVFFGRTNGALLGSFHVGNAGQAGQLATGLVTFTDVNHVTISVGNIQIASGPLNAGTGYGYGEVVFDNVGHTDLRASTLYIGAATGMSQDDRGYIRFTNSPGGSYSLVVSNRMYVADSTLGNGNSIGRFDTEAGITFSNLFIEILELGSGVNANGYVRFEGTNRSSQARINTLYVAGPFGHNGATGVMDVVNASLVANGEQMVAYGAFNAEGRLTLDNSVLTGNTEGNGFGVARGGTNNYGLILFTNGGGFSNFIAGGASVEIGVGAGNRGYVLATNAVTGAGDLYFSNTVVIGSQFGATGVFNVNLGGANFAWTTNNNGPDFDVGLQGAYGLFQISNFAHAGFGFTGLTTTTDLRIGREGGTGTVRLIDGDYTMNLGAFLVGTASGTSPGYGVFDAIGANLLGFSNNSSSIGIGTGIIPSYGFVDFGNVSGSSLVFNRAGHSVLGSGHLIVTNGVITMNGDSVNNRSWSIASSVQGDTGLVSFVDSIVRYTNVEAFNIASGIDGGKTGIFEIIGGTNIIGYSASVGEFNVGRNTPASVQPLSYGQARFINTTGAITVANVYIGDAGAGARGELLYSGGTNSISATTIGIGTSGSRGNLILSNNAVLNSITATNFYVGTFLGGGASPTGTITVQDGSRITSLNVVTDARFGSEGAGSYAQVNLGNMGGGDLTFQMNGNHITMGNTFFTVTNAVMRVNTATSGSSFFIAGNTWNGANALVQIVDSRFSMTNGTGSLEIGAGGLNRTGTLHFIGSTQHITQPTLTLAGYTGSVANLIFDNTGTSVVTVSGLNMGFGAGTATLLLTNNANLTLNANIWDFGNGGGAGTGIVRVANGSRFNSIYVSNYLRFGDGASVNWADANFGDLQGASFLVEGNNASQFGNGVMTMSNGLFVADTGGAAQTYQIGNVGGGRFTMNFVGMTSVWTNLSQFFVAHNGINQTGIVNVTGGVFTNMVSDFRIGDSGLGSYGALILRDTTNSLIRPAGGVQIGTAGASGLMDLGNFVGGEFILTNGGLTVGSGTGSRGELIMTNGEFVFGNGANGGLMQIGGSTANGTGIVTFVNSDVFFDAPQQITAVYNDGFSVAYDGAYGSLSIHGGTNRGTVQYLRVARADGTASGRGDMLFGGFGEVTNTLELSIANGGGGHGSLTFSNGAVLRVTHDGINIGGSTSPAELGIVGSSVVYFEGTTTKDNYGLRTNATIRLADGGTFNMTGTSPNLTVSNGATVRGEGLMQVDGNMTALSGATINPEGNLTNSGNVTANAGANLLVGESDYWLIEGNFTNAATFTIFDSGGFSQPGTNAFKGIEVVGNFTNTLAAGSNITWFFNNEVMIDYMGGMRSTNAQFASYLGGGVAADIFLIDGAATPGYFNRYVEVTNWNGYTYLVVRGTESLAWDGGDTVNSNWSQGLNWVGDAAPANGVGLTFGAVGAARRTNNNDSMTVIGSITFSNSADGSYLLQGQDVDLVEGIVNVGGTNEVAFNINLSNSQFFSSDSGRLIVSGDVTGTNQTLTLLRAGAAGGEVWLTGDFSGDNNLRKLGLGDAFVSGNNTYTGWTLVDGGRLLVTGGFISNNNDVTVGTLNSDTYFIISNGADVWGRSAFIGEAVGQSNHQVIVTGSGSTWTLSSNLVVGELSSRAGLTVSNNGSVTAGHLRVGENVGMVSNTLRVTGGGQLTVSNGLIGVAGGGNTMLLSDSGSVMSNITRFVLGQGAGNNTLTISNGADLYAGSILVGEASAAGNNRIVVTGAGSTITNAGVFVLGASGGNNELLLTNASFNQNGDMLIGSNSAGNAVNIYGSTFSNVNDLTIGGLGGGNSVNLRDGTAVMYVGSDLLIGSNSANNVLFLTNGSMISVGNSLVVGNITNNLGNNLLNAGGEVFVTNATDDALLDIRYGSVTQNSGTITADRLLVTNALGRLAFNAGTMNVGGNFATGGMIYTNGQNLGIGNNAGGATLNLNRGVHILSNMPSFNIADQAGEQSFVYLTNGTTRYTLHAGTMNVGTGIGATGRFDTGADAQFNSIQIGTLNLGNAQDGFGFARFEGTNRNVSTSHITNLNISAVKGTGILEVANQTFVANSGGNYNLGVNNQGGEARILLDNATFSGSIGGGLLIGYGGQDANGITRGALIGTNGASISNLSMDNLHVGSFEGAQGWFIVTNNVSAAHAGDMMITNSVYIGFARGNGEMIVDVAGQDYHFLSTTNGGTVYVGHDIAGYGRLSLSNIGTFQIGAAGFTNVNWYIGENAATGFVDLVGGSWTGRISALNIGNGNDNLTDAYGSLISTGSQAHLIVNSLSLGTSSQTRTNYGELIIGNNNSVLSLGNNGGSVNLGNGRFVATNATVQSGFGGSGLGAFHIGSGAARTGDTGLWHQVGGALLITNAGEVRLGGTASTYSELSLINMDRVEFRNRTNGGGLHIATGVGATGSIYLASQTNVIEMGDMEVGINSQAKGEFIIDGGHTFLTLGRGNGGTFNIGVGGARGSMLLSNGAVLHGWTNINFNVGTGGAVGSTGEFRVLDSSRVGSIYISNNINMGDSINNHGIIDLGNMQGSNFTVGYDVVIGNGSLTVTNANIHFNQRNGLGRIDLASVDGTPSQPVYAEMNIVDSRFVVSNLYGNGANLIGFNVNANRSGGVAGTAIVNFINGTNVVAFGPINVGSRGGTLAQPNYGEMNFVNSHSTVSNITDYFVGIQGQGSFGKVVYSGGTNFVSVNNLMGIGIHGGRGDMLVTNGAKMTMRLNGLQMGFGQSGTTSNSLGNLLVFADSVMEQFLISNNLYLGTSDGEFHSFGRVDLGDMNGGELSIGLDTNGWVVNIGNGSLVVTNANVGYGFTTNSSGDPNGNIYIGHQNPSTGAIHHVNSTVNLSNVANLSIGQNHNSSRGVFIVEGGSNFGNIHQINAGLFNASGLIVFGGEGTISNRNVSLANAGAGHGALMLTNNGTLVIRDSLNMAGSGVSTGILTIANNSRVLMSNFTAHTFQQNAFVNLSNGGAITLTNNNALMQFNAGARLSGYGPDTSVTNNVNASVQMNAESALNLQGGVTHVKGSFSAQNASIINDIGSNTVLKVDGAFTANTSFNLLAGTNYGGFWDPGSIANFSGIELGTNLFSIGAGQQITWLFDSANPAWSLDDPFYGGMRYAGGTNIFQPWVDNNQITFGGLGDAYALGTTNLSGFWYLTVYNVEYIWDGGGANDNWSTDENWVLDKTLINDGKAKVIFADAASTPRLTPDVDAAWDISSLNFSNIVTTTYTIGGEQITLRALGGEGIVQNSVADQVINNNLLISNSQAFSISNSGDLILGGQVEIGNRALTVQGDGAGALVITNGGQLRLSGGGSVTNLSTGGLILYGNGADGNGVIYNQFLNNTIAGDVTLGGASTFRSESGNLIFQGAILGNQDLDKTGLGGLVLNGNSNQIQNMTVQEGIFRLNGNGSTFNTLTANGGIAFITNNTTNTFTSGLIVSNVGTLNVNGLVNGDVTVAQGGVFDVRGNLTVDGSFTAASNSTVTALSGSDTMRVTGAFTNAASFVINDPGNVSFASAPKLILDSSDFFLHSGGTLTWNLLTTPTSDYFGGIGALDLNVFNTWLNNGIFVTGSGVDDFETVFFQTNGYYWLQLSQTAYIWDGGGVDANFGNTNNWVDDRNLASTNVNARVIFADADVTPQQSPVINTNWHVRTVEFSNIVASAYQFSGSNLTIHAGLGGTGMVNNSTITHVFSNNITIASNQSWYANAGSLNFAGRIDVSNRILNLDGAFGGGGYNILSGGQLLLMGGSSISNRSSGGLMINGNGGGTGVIRSQSGANTNVGGFSLGSASTIQVDAGSFTVLGGNVFGSQNLTKTGAGAMILSGIADSDMATLTVAGGALTVNNGSQLKTAQTVLGAGQTNLAMTVNGAGTLHLNSGDISIGDNGISNQFTISGGADVINLGNIGIGANGGRTNTLLVTGAGTVLSNSGGITIHGGLANRNRRIISDGAIVYNATTNNGWDTIDNATLNTDGYVLGNVDEALTEVINGGTLNVTDGSGSAVLEVINGTLDVVNSTVTADQVEALTADGVINVDNSIFHADSILISNAMMNVANGSSLAGSLVVENNGALNVSGGATHTGNVTLEDGSMFSVDSGLLTIDGTLTFNQDFTFNYSEGGQFEVDSLAFGVGNTVTWNFDASPIYSDWLFRSQNDIFGGLIGNQVLATNLAGPYYLASTFSGGYYYIAVIPEPSTYALMILGAVVMIVAVRRARKKQAASF